MQRAVCAKPKKCLGIEMNKQCQNMFCYQPASRRYVHPKTGRMQYRCELCYKKQSKGMINNGYNRVTN